MTRQFQMGFGWSIAEVAVAKQVYGAQTGTSIAIASNVLDLIDGTYIAPAAQNVTSPILSAGNLVMIEKVGRQDWGAVNDRVIFYIGHGTGLYFKKSSASGWKIDVSDNSGASVGVGTTEYAWASSANVPNISVLREATRVRCWVNGVKEVDVSGISSAAWDATTVARIGSTVAVASPHMYIGRILRMSTDVADEYLDPTGLTYQFGVPTGAGMHSGFLTNNYDDVDDWTAGGLSDGDTTYNGDAGVKDTTYRTYNATADFTLANALGVMHYSYARGNVVAKSTTGIAGLGDGTSIVEAGTVVYPDATTYAPLAVSFPTAPGGGAWSAFTMNNLEIGFRHDVGSLGDACVLTAMAVELFGCTFLSDAAAGAARRRFAMIG